jgi:hypothetical protein
VQLSILGSLEARAAVSRAARVTRRTGVWQQALVIPDDLGHADADQDPRRITPLLTGGRDSAKICVKRCCRRLV